MWGPLLDVNLYYYNNRSPDPPVIYNPNTMRELVKYVSDLEITQGRLAGNYFDPLPWQKQFMREAFKPGVATAALSVGRGNGKTALLSGIACATLDGPLMVPRGETLIVASTFEQARIAFEHVVAFMGPRISNPVWRVWDTAQSGRVENRETGARVRVLGSDPRRAHGLAPCLILADEPAQWDPNKSDRMLAALRTAAGKQPSCKFVAIGTKPAQDEHWFARMLTGGADHAQCHAADAEDNPFVRKTWRKANPSLARMPDLLDAIRVEAAEAKTDPAALAMFKSLRLNLGTWDTTRAFLIDHDAWARAEGDMPRTGELVMGLDLGSGASMSAVAACWAGTGRLECISAFPSQPSLGERGLADGVGGLYVTMQQTGDLLTLGDHVVQIDRLLEAAFSRFGYPGVILCDRWREAELLDALSSIGASTVPVITRGQGFRDGGEDVRHFQRAILSGQVRPQKSLLLRSAMAEAVTVSDPAGNRKITKRRDRSRDDAAVAACLAGAHVHRLLSAPVEDGPGFVRAAI